MKELDVRKETNIKYRKHLSYKLSYGAFYAFIVIACFALAILMPATLILTVPLVIIPFTFALQFITSIDNTAPQDQGFSLKRMCKLYVGYFQRQFYGGYRLIEGFFKSLGVYVIFYIIFGLIFVQRCVYTDPELISMVSSINQLEDMASIEQEVLNIMLDNASVQNALFLSFAIALFPALWMFCHHIGTNSIKIHLSVVGGQSLMMPEVHMIHRAGFSTFRKAFYKDYYKTVWWFIPTMAVLYYSGMVAAYFLLPDLQYTWGFVGGALAMLFVSILTPYYFSAIETLFIKYQDKYIEASINQSIKTLNDLKNRNKLEKEEEEEIEKYIKQTQDMLNQVKKEEQEDESEEQKNSDDSES